jgi:hypothetical protein
MKKQMFVFAFAIAVGLGAATPGLFACGDKFLMPQLSTRYERSPAARQAAAVLVYAEPGSGLSSAMASVRSELQKEGYRPRLVSTGAEFAAALRATAWDVVVIDGLPGSSLPATAEVVAPRVVPVLSRPSRDQLKAARKRYGVAVDQQSKPRAFVETFDEAIDLHDADVRAAAKKARH